MKYKCLAALAGVMMSVCSLANAGLIYSATSIIDGPTPIDSYNAANTIDQSGLSSNYISGVTDFNAFIGLSPIHNRVSGLGANFLASFDNPVANVDFDMGEILNLSRLALWNYPFSNSVGINGFSIYSSATSDFSVTSILGTFNAIDNGNGSTNSAQIFDFSDMSSRYIRLSITSSYSGSSVGFSEIAFEGTPAIDVPEPSALAIFALGMIGLASRRFKKQS
jgi:hypothetical protein